MTDNINFTIFRPPEASFLKTASRTVFYPDLQHDAEKVILSIGDENYRFHPDDVDVSDIIIRHLGYSDRAIHEARTEPVTVTGINSEFLLPRTPEVDDHFYNPLNVFYVIGDNNSASQLQMAHVGHYDPLNSMKYYFESQQPDVTIVEIDGRSYATFDYEGNTYGKNITPIAQDPAIHVVTEDGQIGPEIEGIDWRTVQDYIAENQPLMDVIYKDYGEDKNGNTIPSNRIEYVTFELEGQTVATSHKNLKYNGEILFRSLPGERLTINASSVSEYSAWVPERYKLQYSNWDGNPLDQIGFIVHNIESGYRSGLEMKDKISSAIGDEMRNADQYLIDKNTSDVSSQATYAPANYTNITPQMINAMYQDFAAAGIDAGHITGQSSAVVEESPQRHSEFLIESAR